MSLSASKTWVGTSRRLDGYASSWPDARVRVKYEDDDGDTQVVNICADGARLLAKALKQNADLIDPPKKRKKR